MRASTDVRRENRPYLRHGGPPIPGFDHGETDNNYIYGYGSLINAVCSRTIWHGEKLIPVAISIGLIVS